jgi:hypothetical protein
MRKIEDEGKEVLETADVRDDRPSKTEESARKEK